ncbi:scarecrow-like protein 18 [Phoenix dactylifera]|uniref:Scarecrow-like protein 18 n=1 Tax=Phoenix dactylifera TaxID=42345 RepID=A0A8B7CTG7_PHODC|nr:scarecrow-like protein 18 [Phoenix dactylifera]
MLTSLNSHGGGGGAQHHDHRHPSHQSLPHGHIAPSTRSCQLLIGCAELIHRADYSAARRIISLLSTISSPHGDSTDRLVHQFTRALSLHIDSLTHLLPPSFFSSNGDTLQSSYLSLNKVTPFLRFAHLTANQAILEAVDGRQSIHILDFDTSHGVQWPPLLQAIAERSEPSNRPSVRITGTGTDLDVLHRTGDRLKAFASSLGLRFQFHPLHLPTTNPDTSASFSSFQPHPGETLAVNCTLFLHKLLRDRGSDDPACKLMGFLRAVKEMNPAVVTVAEREANHNSPVFLQRFMEALDHYAAVFESLEATLPPKSRERQEVEEMWLGREIEDIVGKEGEERRERHERFEWWEALMRGRGFSSLQLSPFALTQAKLLLRLHYPSEGYQLIQMSKNCLFLAWQHKPLFSVSSWHIMQQSQKEP